MAPRQRASAVLKPRHWRWLSSLDRCLPRLLSLAGVRLQRPCPARSPSLPPWPVPPELVARGRLLERVLGDASIKAGTRSALEAKRVEVMYGRLAACLDRSVELAQDDAKLSAKLEPKAGDCAENGRSEALA